MKTMAWNSTVIKIASTTSVFDSGLMSELKSAFENDQAVYTLDDSSGLSLGSGAALNLARNGGADLVFSHERIGEFTFGAEGYTLHREVVFWNWFILVGPTSGTIYGTLEQGFSDIATNNLTFVTRGAAARSGTWVREQQIWDKIGNRTNNFDTTNSGMMATLQQTAANPSQPKYAMTDIGTWYAFQVAYPALAANLKELTDPIGDSCASNQYVLIPVNPNACGINPANINAGGAQVFLTWLLSGSGKAVVNGFKPDGSHQGFFYNAEAFPIDQCLIKPVP